MDGRRRAGWRRPTIVECEWAALIGLVVLFVWKAFIPAWQSLNTDFPNYYLASRLFRDGYPFERVYDWIWFERQRDHAGIDASNVVGYIPLSPFSALLVALLARLSPLGAKHIWLLLNLVLLASTIILCVDLTQLGRRRIALITFLSVLPLRTNFLFGQQHLLMLFLLTLAVWLLTMRDRPAAAGVVIAVAAVIKIYPAIFALYLVRKRQWTALLGFIAATGVALAVGVGLFGLETWRVYGMEILPRSMAGEGNHPYLIDYNSPAALLRRLFLFEPQLNPNPVLNAPALYSVFLALTQAGILFSVLWCITGHRSRPGREKLEFGAFTAMLLASSTGPASYHLCVLILSTVLAVDYLLRAGRRQLAVVVAVLHAFIAAPYYARFFPGDPPGWQSLLAVPRLYALMAFLVVWVLILMSAPGGEPVALRASPGRALLLRTAAFLGVVVVVTVSSYRNVRARTESYRSRLEVPRPSMIACDPAVGSDGVYFSRQQNDYSAYALDQTRAQLPRTIGTGGDWFHPTLASTTREGWVEIASLTSRIVRFRDPTGSDGAVALGTEVDDGEQPRVSADGRWLGFIREEHGRGSLWIKDRRRGTTEQVLDAAADVRGFSLTSDGRVVVSSAGSRGSELLMLDRNGGPSVTIDTEGHRAKDPAVSPDGKWLAYSREDRGAWHLWIMDLETRHHERITDGNCNSIQPSWAPDSRKIVYGSDCGRAVGQTALCTRDLIGG